MPDSRAEREADLRTYYDNEAAVRHGKQPSVTRARHRDAFIELLRRERRTSVVEVGTGPGRDSLAFRDAGLSLRGIDLAPASVELCRAAGLDVQVGSALELPFATGEFEAAYTASTLLHVAGEDLDTALAELVRVVQPGAPMVVGVWGADRTREQRWGPATYGPPRFFALRSDADLRAALERHATIETFDTWPDPDEDDTHYQWVVLRTPPAADGRNGD